MNRLEKRAAKAMEYGITVSDAQVMQLNLLIMCHVVHQDTTGSAQSELSVVYTEIIQESLRTWEKPESDYDMKVRYLLQAAMRERGVL